VDWGSGVAGVVVSSFTGVALVHDGLEQDPLFLCWV
jgi:hypothetical protein